MPKLERFYLDDFSAEDHMLHGDPYSDPVLFSTPSGQYAFEYLEIDHYDDSAIKAARIGGTALLADARFSGHLGLADGHGEITLRHRPSLA